MKRTMGMLTLSALALLAANQAAVAQSAEEELKQLAAEMEPFNVRVVGLPSGASEWGFLEQPFWADMVPELSGGKITTQINSMSELNLQGGEVFRLTSQGTFDIADIVANYGAGDLPQLDALDLAGVSTTFQEQEAVINAYMPVLEVSLKERFGLETLGGAHSTPQVFFCRGDINGAADLAGKRVRLTSSTLADVVTGLGGVPVTMSFGEAVPAMERGVVDCIITGTMSGNTGKLYEVGDVMFTLTVGWAPRLRIANSAFWERLDDSQRQWLQKATDYYFTQLQDEIEVRNANEGIWCTTGDERCTLAGQSGVEMADMKLVEPDEEDLELLRKAVTANVLPAFARACGEDCTKSWNETIGATVGLQAQP